MNLAELHHLIQGQLGCTFPRSTLVRIEATSAGNFFYRPELARALLAAGVSGVGAGPLPVPARCKHSWSRAEGRSEHDVSCADVYHAFNCPQGAEDAGPLPAADHTCPQRRQDMDRSPTSSPEHGYAPVQ